MNRVYPLREGSGECSALDKFDAALSGEFRRSFEKISFQIISLLKHVYLLRHSLSLWLCRRRCRHRATHRPPPGGNSKIKEDRERCDLGAAGVGDVEVLVLESRAEHGDVRLYADAPREIGAVVREPATREHGVDVAVQLPVRGAHLAVDVHDRQWYRQGAAGIG